MFSTTMGWFRFVTIIEGISYVLLLGVGLPTKLFMGNEEITRILGSIHGGLFIAFGLLLLYVGLRMKWSLYKMALIFIASFIPIGNFVIDRKVLKQA